MKLSDYMTAPKVTQKTPKNVLKLPDNEAERTKLESEITKLTTERNKQKDIQNSYNELNVRFKDNQHSLNELIGTKKDLELKLEQQNTAKNLLETNNADLRKQVDKISTLDNKIQALTTQCHELTLDNTNYIHVLETFEVNLTQSQQKQEELAIINAENEQKIRDFSEKQVTLTALNTKLGGENSDYSRTLTLTLESFRALELQSQQLINDNTAAREKIFTLEGIKTQLDNWVKNLNKDYSNSSSKSSALEQKLNDSRIVIEDLGKTVQALIAEKEDVIRLVQYYQKELLKNPPSNVGALMKEMKIPFMGDAVRRQSLGHSKQTLLKFNIKEGDSDDISTL